MNGWMIYFALGLVTAVCSIAWWRGDPRWQKHWSDWFAVLMPPLLVIWPIFAVEMIADLVRYAYYKPSHRETK